MLVQQCHSSIISYDFRDYSWLRLGLGVGKWSRLHFFLIKMLFQGQQYMMINQDVRVCVRACVCVSVKRSEAPS